ncbi:afadin- and alpha-actinin-binding protein isoform X2 [Betta splendens]|uniref:Afadin- and alpha-actinin-binding protein isoform X2 n=1 Tax=Betta splendens TaxID=158456 RepID=A0A6P7NJG5_BETSP|nr:afadin- and alpha-actinin-binding protein isoform X2 [Betta splendens]
MASRIGQRRFAKQRENLDSYLLRGPGTNPVNERVRGATWWTDRDERAEQDSLREMDEHVSRLQDSLKHERTKGTRLQLRCNHQEAELRRREQQCARVKERLSQLTERGRDKAPVMEALNFLPGGRGQREQPVRSLRHEEATLRLMLERREAELREETRLRHSLTTVLHALSVDMGQALKDAVPVQDEAQSAKLTLDQAEGLLGVHATGGVIQSWRQVQKRLGEVLPEGRADAGTDHDKLLAQLEAELRESQQLVRLQQQLLQDSLSSPVNPELADCYFVEEWERLQMRLLELEQQRRSFERERQAFTDAAIRLSHERRDFEQQKALLLKQQCLSDSPLFGKASMSNRRESTALNFSGLGPSSVSGCLPITPSSTESGARVRFQTPTTPELYSALNLSYNCRARDVYHQLHGTWDGVTEGVVQAPHLDWSF